MLRVKREVANSYFHPYYMSEMRGNWFCINIIFIMKWNGMISGETEFSEMLLKSAIGSSNQSYVKALIHPIVQMNLFPSLFAFFVQCRKLKMHRKSKPSNIRRLIRSIMHEGKDSEGLKALNGLSRTYAANLSMHFLVFIRWSIKR